MASVVDVLASLAPQYVEWSKQIKNAVKAGRTQFPTGRTIHLQQPYPHKAPNYCVQGTARELLVDALMRWRDTRRGNATLLPVHDELVVAVPAEDAEQATTALVAAMQSQLYDVAIVADPSEPAFAWADST